MLVAAVAETNECVIVTDNEKHFSGLDVLNHLQKYGESASPLRLPFSARIAAFFDPLPAVTNVSNTRLRNRFAGHCSYCFSRRSSKMLLHKCARRIDEFIDGMSLLEHVEDVVHRAHP